MSDNRQLLVRGGPGSGKTWMAERHALRLAASGLDVLFLCYNKALGATFQHDIPRLQRKAVKGAPGGGRLTVRTWEALCDEFASDYPGLPSKPAPGATREEMIHYYENKLPGAMYEEVYKDDFKPPFDALIVDEAQDHNTDWWEKLYFPLLRNETSAPMGIYYDGAQRPAFREGSFDLGAIAGKLSQPGHLRLLETRRYTRPIFDFLRALESDETRSLVDGLASNHLLAGPEMLSEEHPHLEAAKSAAAARLKLWFKDKLANPADTLVLTRIDPFGAKSPVFRNCETFAGFTLVPADAPHAFEKGNLRATSFNKAKGLDARAVVLLDTLPWENLPPGERVAFWIAASRARQMLAVFATKQ